MLQLIQGGLKESKLDRKARQVRILIDRGWTCSSQLGSRRLLLVRNKADQLDDAILRAIGDLVASQPAGHLSVTMQ